MALGSFPPIPNPSGMDPFPPVDDGSGGGGIELLDEGVSLGIVTSLDITGAGATASAVGAAGTIDIPGGGGGAPVDAEYVVLALHADLTQERVLTAGSNITLTDGGANGPVTLDVINVIQQPVYVYFA